MLGDASKQRLACLTILAICLHSLKIGGVLNVSNGGTAGFHFTEPIAEKLQCSLTSLSPNQAKRKQEEQVLLLQLADLPLGKRARLVQACRHNVHKSKKRESIHRSLYPCAFILFSVSPGHSLCWYI